MIITIAAVIFTSPLILDLSDDGIQTVSLERSSVFFDIDNDKYAERTAWISSDDGFLVLDEDGDGMITSQSEMFGEGYVSDKVSLSLEPIETEAGPAYLRRKVVNGFEKLAIYDSNNNHLFDAGDDNWNNVKVWQDINSNGKSDEFEILSLNQLGVISIDLNWVEQDVEQNGNKLKQKGRFTYIDGSIGEITDVWFAYNPKDTRKLNAPPVTDKAILKMPRLTEWGEVPNFYYAISTDNALKEMVAQFTNIQSESLENLLHMTEAIIMRWYGGEELVNLEGNSEGLNVDAQYLVALDKNEGYAFMQRGLFRQPKPNAGAALTRRFKNHLSHRALSLYLQTEAGKENLQNVEKASFGPNVIGPVDYALSLSKMKAVEPFAETMRLRHWKAVAAILSVIVRRDKKKKQEVIDDFNHLSGLSYDYDTLLNAHFGQDEGDYVSGISLPPVVKYYSTPESDDLIMGGNGDDLLFGGFGKDTYLYGAGHGNDTIDNLGKLRDFKYQHELTSRTGNTVKFIGLNRDDVEIRAGNGEQIHDLEILIKATGETLTIKNQLEEWHPKIKYFDFEDECVSFWYIYLIHGKWF